MDASEAKAHLEMVERIIGEGSRCLRAGGEFFLVWGLVGAGIDALVTLAEHGLLPSGAWFAIIYTALLLIGVGFSVVRVRYYRRTGERMSLLQRDYLNVLWVTVLVVGVAMFTTAHLLTTTAAQMTLWSLADSILLFYIAMQGNTRAKVGGILLYASIVAANFAPQYAGWILSLGVLLGYAGFGAAELLVRE